MDSGVQSPDMAHYYNAANHFHHISGGLPLAGSMHAVVPHAPFPLHSQPITAPTAVSHQFETRINRLEQQHFQEGVNAQFRSMQMSQSFQHLQQQLYHMQQIIAYDVPTLRYQVQALEAKLDRRENEDCTRLIQLEPRSQEQKLLSAMRNPNLTRISTSVSHGGTTEEKSSVHRAEQMEALATSLRGRVHRGGAAYLLEAEDAEAWATKLREDAKAIEQPELDNELSKSHGFEDWSKMDTPADAAITNINLDAETTREKLEDWQIATPAQSVLASASQSVFSKCSELRYHTFDCPKSPSIPPLAASIKIEESSSTSNVSPIHVEAVPELQTKKLAPHLRYATKQVQTSKRLTQKTEDAIDNKTTNDKMINDGTTKEAAYITQAQVPSKPVPSRRRKRNRTKTPAAFESKAGVPTRERKESTASGLVVARAVSDVFKIEASSAQKEAISAKNTPSTTLKNDESISTLDLNTAPWQPSYLKELPLLSPSEFDQIPSSQEMHTFSRTFILNHLGGIKWLPSFYSVPHSELSLLPGRGFYLLEDSTEPLAPISPGHHGSLVTPILRLPEAGNPSTPDPDSMTNAPLFLKRGDRYIYYGMYTYLRSDRLDLERCNTLLPTYLKHHWALQLTAPKRPKWVTGALKSHLRAPPTYSRPSSSASETHITASLSSHHRELEAWHRDTSLMTSFLRPENIISAFESPDTGAEIPGLRFWCLGLQCEGWDRGFYDMMCREEKIWEKQGRKDGEREREERKEMMRLLGKGGPVKW